MSGPPDEARLPGYSRRRRRLVLRSGLRPSLWPSRRINTRFSHKAWHKDREGVSLNVGVDGNVLFDAHAGYEVGGLLGNVRDEPVEELVLRQREFAPLLFRHIEGFCPVRDEMWPKFLRGFITNPLGFRKRRLSVREEARVGAHCIEIGDGCGLA